MSNVITAIEDAMVARLMAKLPRTFRPAESFPDQAENFDFPVSNEAACYVRYDRSTYAGPDAEPRRAYAPMRTLSFEVIVLVRSLRGAQDGRVSSYDALEAVRLALQGQSFGGATAMAPAGDQLQARDAGVWRWAIRFTCRAPAVAVADAGERSTMLQRAEAS
ncbi:Gp37 family protein [Ancylobacter sp. A5.8]|uniref:Gp37 family protein n=1 Tax=Ancylobacter gelatini TaxID=2919920 RepID=UPI001F4EBF55|nr:Gp37 family protein [Ancylobacter gelatini]MCJ8142964.1 Gp37 family protein [Ancylobacter gelatini]